MINKNIDFIATHDDPYYPACKRPHTGCGIYFKINWGITGKHPSKIFGKPNIDLKHIIRKSRKTIVIGDRISKDIKFANNSNYDSALVLSGAEKDVDIKDKRFNFLLSSIKDLT